MSRIKSSDGIINIDDIDYVPFLIGTERKYLLSIPRINRIVFMGYNQQKPVETTEE